MLFVSIAAGFLLGAQSAPKYKSKNGFIYTTVKDVLDEEEYDNRHSTCTCCYKTSQFFLN